MISNVLSYVAGLIITVIGVALYLFLISRILPDIFLRPSKENSRRTGRGIKKYKYKDGRAIVYEPSLKAGRYIRQYIISKNSSDKFLKCMVDERIEKISYTVIAMDAGDRVVGMIDVDDKVNNNEYTKAVVLPTETSYVDIIVNEVNGCIVADRDKILFSGRSMLIYIGCSALMTSILSAVIYSIASEVIDMIFGLIAGMKIDMNGSDLILSLAVGALVGALIGFLVCIPYKNANTRIIPANPGKKLFKNTKGA